MSGTPSKADLAADAAARSEKLMEEGADPTSVSLPTLQERSDFDVDDPDYSVLGESMGDGVYMSDPVKIYRRADGTIFRTIPLHEAADVEEQMLEDGLIDERAPWLAEPVTIASPLNRRQREQVVDAMALRLYQDYEQRPRDVAMYNPIYDGIPFDQSGSDPRALQQKRGDADLVPASAFEILEWFSRLIGVRAEFINAGTIGPGYKTDVVNTLRIHREPIQ